MDIYRATIAIIILIPCSQAKEISLPSTGQEGFPAIPAILTVAQNAILEMGTSERWIKRLEHFNLVAKGS